MTVLRRTTFSVERQGSKDSVCAPFFTFRTFIRQFIWIVRSVVCYAPEICLRSLCFSLALSDPSRYPHIFRIYYALDLTNLSVILVEIIKYFIFYWSVDLSINLRTCWGEQKWPQHNKLNRHFRFLSARKVAAHNICEFGQRCSVVCECVRVQRNFRAFGCRLFAGDINLDKISHVIK